MVAEIKKFLLSVVPPQTEIEKWKYVEPKWGPIGKEVYERTYSRADSDGRGETWYDTVRRTVRGNIALVDQRFIEPQEEEKLFDLVYNFKGIPAGRHLWVSGVPGRQFLFNCHRAGWTKRFSRHFEFTFNELMKGGGVGANYSNDYISQYPPIANPVTVQLIISPAYNTEDLEILRARKLIQEPYSEYRNTAMWVEDTREGWYTALNAVLEAYFSGTPQNCVFDLSLLRPMGTIIKGFGGIASGPWALATLLQQVANFLNTKVGQKLTSLDMMELDHLIASCVVAGNVRRSARMAVKHWADRDIWDFIKCKTDTSKHWSTNISVEVDDDFWNLVLNDGPPASPMTTWAHAHAVFEAVVKGMVHNGEPGIINTSLASVGERGDVRCTNPCGEIFLEEWENCNLGHINLGLFAQDNDGAREAFRLMQRYLIRATFGDITDSAQRDVVDRNRRTGVGIFGYQAWTTKQGVKFSDSWKPATGIPLQLAEFKKVCQEEALKYSTQLGIATPIKTTTVAPTGTIAKLSGTSEGIHPIYARYFLRRVRYPANDTKLQSFQAQGYAIEADQYSANSMVVTFPCKDILVEELETLGLDPLELVEDASELHPTDMMSVQAMVQQMYSDNAIAFTMNFPPEKYNEEDFKAALLQIGPDLKGTTAMPDGTRPQAPYERISEEQYAATGVGGVSQGEMECVNNACPIK